MRKKDLEIKIAIENILENTSPGQHLKNYFAGLPEKRLRRAISILSGMYPDKITSSDEEFSFIRYMFSDVKFMGQESFSSFVRAVNILDFTEHQKELFKDVIKKNIEMLCALRMFELDALLENLFEPKELFQYLEVLAEQKSRPVLLQISDIVRYQDFSNSCVPDDKIEALKQKISQSIKLQ